MYVYVYIAVQTMKSFTYHRAPKGAHARLLVGLLARLNKDPGTDVVMHRDVYTGIMHVDYYAITEIIS